jgi:cyclase
MPQKSNAFPASEHFELKQLAKGVYAAIATEDGAAYSNAGIVDLGDQTLIFDAFETPQAANDLRLAAEHLTGRPPTCVIISHSHADHWCGNQAFAPHVPIITTHTTLEEMPQAIGWLEEPGTLSTPRQTRAVAPISNAPLPAWATRWPRCPPWSRDSPT